MKDGKIFAVHVPVTQEQVHRVSPKLFEKLGELGVPYNPREIMHVGLVDGSVPVITKEEVEAAMKQRREAEEKSKQEGDAER